jgi:hypothetical protein
LTSTAARRPRDKYTRIREGMPRAVLLVAVLVAVAGCSGDESSDEASASLDGVTLAVGGVPPDETEVTAEEWPGGGPPEGWAATPGVQFSVRAPEQTVDRPATLTFTIEASRFDEETRGQVDQLGVYLPGGEILVATGDSFCANERAEPDPCIASAEFLENGDGRLVILASDAASGEG